MTAVEEFLLGLDEEWEIPDEEVAAAERAAADLAWVTTRGRWLRAVQRERDQIRVVAEAEINRIQDHAARADAPLAARAAYLETCLGDYALRERERSGGRVKFIDTPYARVTTRSAGGEWTAGQEAADWLKENRADLVRTVDTVKVAEAKRSLVETDDGVVDPTTGVLVPGIVVGPRRLAATVTVVAAGDES